MIDQKAVAGIAGELSERLRDILQEREELVRQISNHQGRVETIDTISQGIQAALTSWERAMEKTMSNDAPFPRENTVADVTFNKRLYAD